MKLLVDTHCWLWALARPEALNANAAALLSDGKTEIVLSAASVWEIAIKLALGKLRVTMADGITVFDVMDRQGLTQLPVLHSHARHVATLPPIHADPFDRLLIAQAQLERLPLMTADEQLLPYEVEVIWAARRKPRRERK